MEGISLIPYSPIGGGVLSGKYRRRGLARWRAVQPLYLAMEGRQAAMGHHFINEKSLS